MVKLNIKLLLIRATFLFMFLPCLISNGLVPLGVKEFDKYLSILFIIGTFLTSLLVVKVNFKHVIILFFLLIVNYTIILLNYFLFFDESYLLIASLMGIYKLSQITGIFVLYELIKGKDQDYFIRMYLRLFYFVNLPAFVYYVGCLLGFYSPLYARYIIYESEIGLLRFGGLAGEPSFFVFSAFLALFFLDTIRDKPIYKILVLVMILFSFSNLGIALLITYYTAKYRKHIPLMAVPLIIVFVTLFFLEIPIGRFRLTPSELSMFLSHGEHGNNPLLVRFEAYAEVWNSIIEKPFGYGILGYKSVQFNMTQENVMISGAGILQFTRDMGIAVSFFLILLFLAESIKSHMNPLLVFSVVFVCLQDTYLLLPAWFFIITYKLWCRNYAYNHRSQLERQEPSQ